MKMPMKDPAAVTKVTPVADSGSPEPAPAVAPGVPPPVPPATAAAPATTATAAPRARPPRRARRPALDNAFRSAFLSRLDLRDEPDSAREMENAGPWEVRPAIHDGHDGHGVFRTWQRPGRDAPRVWFTTRERARLAALLLPALGQEPWLTLTEQPGGGSALLLRGAGRVGVSAVYDPDLAQALNVAEHLRRSPAALAELLLDAGPQAVILVGALMAHDLTTAGEDREP
jgi:hypothetical protein